MLPVSSDMLLRVVRRRVQPLIKPLVVIGIGDWAWQGVTPLTAAACAYLPTRQLGRLSIGLSRIAHLFSKFVSGQWDLSRDFEGVPIGNA